MYITAAKYIYSLLFGRVPLSSFLKKHFGRLPEKYPIVSAEFPRFRHPCVALALSRYMKLPGVDVKVIGTSTDARHVTLSELMHPDSENGQVEGPMRSIDIAVANDKHMSFASHGLYLVRGVNGKFAVWVSQAGQFDEEVVLEVISKERKTCRQFISDIRRLADENSVYKGKVISFRNDRNYGPQAKFENVRKVERGQLILPELVLEEIDRHTSSFSRHHKRLVDSHMHLKRGLLLYGPPGSGKTSTMMYVVSSMPGRTTIFVGARGSEMLEHACELARSLQPATIIIDDVDLIAGERNRAGNNNEALGELLNQMDGIADDADVLFLLSTNSPESLEPALAARPGRIDQAICIPLPDADCRRRLFELYGRSMNVVLSDVDSLIAATEGASGAFIKELFRRALLLAAEQGDGAVIVDDAILGRALQSIKGGSPMMAKILAYEAVEPQLKLELAV